MILFLLTMQYMTMLAQVNAITYELPSGRFGENVLAWAMAKWISHKYKMQLLYKPFDYSDQLKLHKTNYTFDRMYKKYVQQKRIVLENEREFTNNSSTLYSINYFHVHLEEWCTYDEGNVLKSNEAAIIEELKQHIQPLVPFDPLPLPANTITIALHVRKGGGFDLPLLSDNPPEETLPPQQRERYDDVRFPLKFPPDHYYIAQVAYLAEFFKDQKLYVHIFTDDKNPAALADRYAAALNNERISFGYRTSGNAHDAQVVEDFVALGQFDCLIRPDSAFSKAAQLLGNYKVIIYPASYTWHGNRLEITKVTIQMQTVAQDMHLF